MVNVWDVISAKVVADVEGTTALATASHSIAAAWGYEDGENIPLDLMLDTVGRIVAATDLPVTADLEGGYGDAAETVRRAIGVGVVGANIEDQLKPIPEAARQVEAIMKVAEAEGVDFVLNARTDAFHLQRKRDPAENLAEAIERGRAYLDAGAPVVFVPAILDEAQVEEVVEAFGPQKLTLIGDPRAAVAEEAGGARRRAGLLRPAVAERRPHRAAGDDRGRAARRRGAGEHADPQLTRRGARSSPARGGVGLRHECRSRRRWPWTDRPHPPRDCWPSGATPRSPLVRKEEQAEALGAEGVEARLLDIEAADEGQFAAGVPGLRRRGLRRRRRPRRQQDRASCTVDLGGSLKSIAGARRAGVTRFVQISAIDVDEDLPDDTDEVWRAYVEAKRDADKALRGERPATGRSSVRAASPTTRRPAGSRSGPT